MIRPYIDSSLFQKPLKRVRHSRTIGRTNEAGPSNAVYSPPSPCSDDTGSEYESPPPRPRAPRPRSSKSKSRRPRTRRNASNGKWYHCLVKSCKKQSRSFNTPKDRNRHLDTHFGPRFECPSCKKLFPRDDALKRHCGAQTKSEKCRGAHVEHVRYAVRPPDWLTCSLDLLVRPPDSDPLIRLWRRRE